MLLFAAAPATAQNINVAYSMEAGYLRVFADDLAGFPLQGNVPIVGTAPAGTVINYNGSRFFINLPSSPAGQYNFSFSIGTATITVALDVLPQTTTTLSSSANPSTSGQAVTFTASVTPSTATGNVVFSIDGINQPPATLTAGVASLSTSSLAAGNRRIKARYEGDAGHWVSESSTLSQTVNAPPTGSITIRQETTGEDAVFAFVSGTPELNLSIATLAGSGGSPAIALPPGSYTVTAQDMTGAGFALTALQCSDADSTVDLAQRTAHINLGANEALVCTFTATNSRAATTALIEDFMSARAGLILANQPDVSRRINRLNGVVSSGGPSVASLMGYVPSLLNGSPLSVSGSLSAIDAATGNAQQGALDAWFEGTFAMLHRPGGNGAFSSASVGADYLVNADLMIGGFVQIDAYAQPGSIEGTGWLAGPYLTARLSDILFLDLLAAGGTSSNRVNAGDSFDATRYLLSASLQGDWQVGDWTFGPRARLSYFEESSASYVNGLGVAIPAVTAGVGQLAIGPSVSYRFVADGEITIDAGVRFDGVLDLVSAGTIGVGKLHGRIEGTLHLGFGGGARLGLLTAYDGIGGSRQSTSVKASLTIPVR